jgi:tetratricopeptide (TPR) repeat protein
MTVSNPKLGPWGRRTALAFCLLLTLIITLGGAARPAVAQGKDLPPTPANAEELFQSGAWEKAVVANEAVVQAEPGNGRAWFRLGFARVHLKRYDDAAAAFDRAEAAGYTTSPYLRFGRAAVAAARHQKEQALSELDRAVSAGFADSQALGADENLKALAGDPRYKQLVERIERPCEADPAYHKLDFWLGHWDVFAEGKLDGTNFIEKTLNGCALIENWKEADGHEGKSLFYYNPVTKERKQVWVTDVGPLKEKLEVEAAEKGAVRFQGEIPQKGGGKILDRTTLTPLSGDRVRQVIERSDDGGKTWQVAYDAAYVRPKTGK